MGQSRRQAVTSGTCAHLNKCRESDVGGAVMVAQYCIKTLGALVLIALPCFVAWAETPTSHSSNW